MGDCWIPVNISMRSKEIRTVAQKFEVVKEEFKQAKESINLDKSLREELKESIGRI